MADIVEPAGNSLEVRLSSALKVIELQEAEIERLREIVKKMDSMDAEMHAVIAGHTEYLDDITARHGRQHSEQRKRIAELEAALACCRSTLRRMQDNAFKTGLVGTSDWDNVAGEADLFGAIDKADATLNKEQS